MRIPARYMDLDCFKYIICIAAKCIIHPVFYKGVLNKYYKFIGNISGDSAKSLNREPPIKCF